MVSKSDTIVAIATPAGRGGLGIVRVSGPAAHTMALSIAQRDKLLTPRHAHYCKIHDHEERVIDEGLLVFFPGPNSYTGEDVLEVYAHGSRIVLGRIVDHILKTGGRLARPGEFTERAFLNDKIDLVQAEAVADLIDATSEHAARSAMRSLDGEFSRRIDQLLEAIIRVRTFVEGSLDFPDEEIDFLSEADIEQQINAIVDNLDAITVRAQQGAVLKEGIGLAIVGRPNVGKSTLLNQLAGREAAIVTEIPGTTRDPVEQDILIDGIPVRIIDTAGLRETGHRIELEGIRRTHHAIRGADIVVYVQDYNDRTECSDSWMQEYAGKKILHVVNKIDLYEVNPAVNEDDEGRTKIMLSAKTGAGMELLTDQLKNLMGLQELFEDVFMARKRHLEALEKTCRHLHAAGKIATGKDSTELMAEELRLAQEALGEITGKYVADDLLGSIFSSFCIGK